MTAYLVEPSDSPAPPIRLAARSEHELFGRVEAHLRKHRALSSAAVTVHHVGPGRLRFTQPAPHGRTHSAWVTFRKDQA